MRRLTFKSIINKLFMAACIQLGIWHEKAAVPLAGKYQS